MRIRLHSLAYLAGGLLLLGMLFDGPLALAQVEIHDDWRYNVRQPGRGWQNPDFDDGEWTPAKGGFGASGTPGARIGTAWQSDDIWLRKRVKLTTIPQQAALWIHHDENAQVFLNGRQVADLKGFTTDYKLVPLDADARGALREGENLLAVHCKQTGGGQFIDVHLVDAANVPKLPEAERQTRPFQSELITTWGEQVTAENAWTEYPRPQFVRENWTNLNGHWDYAVTAIDQTQPPSAWDGKILVPFCLESRLSGVQRLLDRSEALWYHRQFDAAPRDGKRLLLNFEAVDYRCRVWVNGQEVGEHVGGNTPFTLDVTDAIRDGKNELIVRVEDETEGWQLRGKQVVNPRGIWYTQVSGIWQTVWLEEVQASYLSDVTITTDAARGAITVRPVVDGDADRLRIRVLDKGTEVAAADGQADEFELTVDAPKLWSPDSPYLYDLSIELLDASGRVVDSVASYAGIRSVGKVRDDAGHLRMTLNGDVIFHLGPLDQGWWPDGLLTPPSDEAMLFDVEFLKAAGFNMIRKHIKVEPRRYYYHCDRLGIMLWQDQVSAGHNANWTRLMPDPKDAEWPDEHHQQYMVELERMIDSLENHPSIVVWVPFNEAWGQHRTMEVGAWAVERDPTRLINVASGGNFWPVGDVVDAHAYPHPAFPFDADQYDEKFIKVMGEFGGHGYPIRGHLWDADRRNWGYGTLPQSMEEYRQRYAESLTILDDLRSKGIAAGVYTQTTDVEGEINGLITYDRKVIKMPAEELKKLHERFR